MKEFRKNQILGEDAGGSVTTVRTDTDGRISMSGTSTVTLGDIDQIKELKSGTIDQVKSGSIEQTNFTETRSATIAADNVGLLKGSGTLSQVDSVGGTVTVDEQRTDTITGTSTKSISTSAGTLATASADRQNLIVQNASTQVVTIGLPTVASGVGSGGTGIVLNGANSSGQAGGEFSTTEYTGEVRAIAETGTASVRVTEI